MKEKELKYFVSKNFLKQLLEKDFIPHTSKVIRQAYFSFGKLAIRSRIVYADNFMASNSSAIKKVLTIKKRAKNPEQCFELEFPFPALPFKKYMQKTRYVFDVRDIFPGQGFDKLKLEVDKFPCEDFNILEVEYTDRDEVVRFFEMLEEKYSHFFFEDVSKDDDFKNENIYKKFLETGEGACK